MIDNERSERVVGVGECGQPEGLSKPCESTAAFPQTVSGSRAVDTSDGVVWWDGLLVVRSVGVHCDGVETKLDARGQDFADVKAPGALAIVPVEAVPVRAMTWSSGWAAAAAGFAATDVLLAIDDPIRLTSPSAEVGAPSFRHRHVALT